MISTNQTLSVMTDINGNMLSTNQLISSTSSLWLLSEYLAGPLHQLDRQLNYYLNDIWQEHTDERVVELPFMGDGPWKLLAAISLYVFAILYLGPQFINSKKKPFELNWTIRSYNLMMIISNCWAFYHGCRILNYGLSCFGCEIINSKDNSPAGLELLRYGWLFFLSRIIEWLDTMFFVLRKKPSQITKLHLFHHSFVPLLVWTYLKFHPGKTVAFFPLVNSLVHTIMYSYYFLATFGPKIQPYLWWKKYLTSMQITQFVLILIQLATIPLSTSQECQYPRMFLYMAFAGAILFLYLFYSYYKHTYNCRHHQCSPKHDLLSKSNKSN